MKKKISVLPKRLIQTDIWMILILIICPLAVFWWVPRTFLQQDEWYFLGQYLLAQTDPAIIFRVFSGMHFLPVEHIVLFTQYRLFWLHPVGYAVVSLLTHVGVTVLFYTILRMLRIRAIPACIGTLFFSLNPISSQVVSWSPASASGGVSVLLFLAACMLWVRSVRKALPWYITALMGVLFIASLLSKSDIVVGFVFILTVPWLVGTKNRIPYRSVLIPFVIWIAVFAAVWLFAPKDNNVRATNSLMDIAGYLSSTIGWSANIVITYNAFEVVLKNILGPYASYIGLVDNEPALRFISSLIAGLWYLSIGIVAYLGKAPLKKFLIFPCFIVLSMVPYFFSITRGLESRHYYIPVLLSGTWIAFLLDWLQTKRFFSIRSTYVFICICLFVFYGFANQPYYDVLPFHAKRQKLVMEMEKVVNPVEGTVVYFFEKGASTPFQSGIGQMLLVLQAKNDPSFVPYFRSEYPYKSYFLYGMFEQGFEKLGNKGFGYYFDREELAKDLGKGLFSKDEIRAFVYDEKQLTYHPIPTESVLESPPVQQ